MNTNSKFNVISLFDGISCARVACERAGILIDKYYASEIKKSAIKCAKYNFPDTIQLGDVRNVNWFGLPKIDLFFSGNPCQGISGMNQKQKGLQHKESILFWDAVRILKDLQAINPKIKFIFENVHGNKESINTITKTLGVNPISINSKLVSAQNRPRYYWTNIQGITKPNDKCFTSRTLHDTFKVPIIGEKISEGRKNWINGESGKRSIQKGYTKINPFPKYGCILASGHKKWNENYLLIDGEYYHLSKFELEWLQTLPPGYTSMLSYAEAYDVIGDGWTIDIIAHILSFIN